MFNEFTTCCQCWLNVILQRVSLFSLLIEQYRSTLARSQWDLASSPPCTCLKYLLSRCVRVVSGNCCNYFYQHCFKCFICSYNESCDELGYLDHAVGEVVFVVYTCIHSFGHSFLSHECLPSWCVPWSL